MREGKFLKQNIDRWQSYLEDTQDPDEQADRFVNLIDDLAYSKTYYPKSNTTQYVNGIAGKLFSSIYLGSRRKKSNFVRFFKYELPYIFGKYHKLYIFTLCFFVATCLLAMAASIHDYGFIREVLGDDYVEMTESNIRNGKPFGVYDEQKPFQMFVQIAFNNIRVSFMTFTFGVFAGLPTLYLLFTNGLMLGAFQTMFFKHGLGWDSILVIWIHGTLEINAIVIAGTAGLMLGFGFLFPGTYTRMQSLKVHARDSIKLIIALVPFFIVAALLESYITRLTSMPVWLSGGILAASWFVIIFYFIVWPIQVKRKAITFDVDGQMFVNGVKKDLVG
jgi:uncharacterized membrane protein SpoIIM required for sporulation